MPKTLTEDDAFVESVDVPIGGDRRTAASVHPGFQALSNRTRFLRKWQQSIDPDRVGISLIRSVPTIDALSKVPRRADGEVAIVMSGGSRGVPTLYVYSAAATLVDGAWAVQPADGRGRWLHVDHAMRGVSAGLAPLDAKGLIESRFLRTTPLASWVIIVPTPSDPSTPLMSVTSPNWINVATTAFDVPDDGGGFSVAIEATCGVNVTPNTICRLRLTIDGSLVPGSQRYLLPGYHLVTVSMNGVPARGHSGTVAFQAFANAQSGSSPQSNIYGDIYLRVTVTRWAPDQ